MVQPKKRRRYYEKPKDTIIKSGFSLTPNDQITYIYKKEKEEYLEVTNVSYEIKMGNEWMTIVRYDSAHGYLHWHIRISLDDPEEAIVGEIKQGSPHDWLTIALADVRTNFLEYRRQFFERSNIVDTFS